MIIATKVEKQFRERLARMRHAPDIICPFVGRDCPHFISGHVSIHRLG